MIGAILAALAIGAVVTMIVKITYNWFRGKIEEKLAKRTVKKVFAKTIDKFVEDCENEMTLDEMKTLKKADMVIASLDHNNQVEDVDIVTDENSELDREVEELLDSRGEILVTS